VFQIGFDPTSRL